jgi:hypothetical protein
MCHPIAADHVLAVCGGHEAFGNWQAPKPMRLVPERRLHASMMEHCWEYVFTVSRSYPVTIEYRYLVLNTLTGTAVWEREPNRQIVFTGHETADDGAIEIVDANFVTGMHIDVVPPALFIGPYPQLSEDIDVIKACGVTAVINLQTDADMRQRSIDWQRLYDYYQAVGIACYRLPIWDFNEDDLIAKLPEAVSLLKRLLDAGQHVYLHCTAGMGRAPAVAVAYLCRHHDKSLDEAFAYVKRYRPVVCPNLHAIRRALTGGV